MNTSWYSSLDSISICWQPRTARKLKARYCLFLIRRHMLKCTIYFMSSSDDSNPKNKRIRMIDYFLLERLCSITNFIDFHHFDFFLVFVNKRTLQGIIKDVNHQSKRHFWIDICLILLSHHFIVSVLLNNLHLKYSFLNVNNTYLTI